MEIFLVGHGNPCTASINHRYLIHHLIALQVSSTLVRLVAHSLRPPTAETPARGACGDPQTNTVFLQRFRRMLTCVDILHVCPFRRFGSGYVSFNSTALCFRMPYIDSGIVGPILLLSRRITRVHLMLVLISAL